jgi:hypothetical protein
MQRITTTHLIGTGEAQVPSLISATVGDNLVDTDG